MSRPMSTQRVVPGAALVLTSLLAAPSSSAAPPTHGDERPPSLVLVLADDLGWGDLGCYGQRAIRTPNLDRLAAEGMRFTNFYAGSTVCAPSRCVLMTGRHTGRAWIRGNARLDLRPEDVTVAEVLRDAGYATGCFGKWGLGSEDGTGHPERQGFERFFGYLDQRHAHNYWPTFLIDGQERRALGNVVPNEDASGAGKASEKVDYAPDLIFAEAVAWLRALDPERPFFLYLPYTLPHANNEAGQEGMEVPELGEYAERDWPAPQKGHAAMITRLDSEVGRLVALLEELGRAEDTLVLFSSDNGPHREGGNDPDFQDSNGPLRGIKRSLHDGGIRVPLIARWPGRIAPGAVSDHVGYFGDLFATAAELAGAEVTGEAGALDSLSFLPELLGREQAAHERLYWEFYERGGAQAVRFGRWKALRAPMGTGEVRLFDLETDLGEGSDQAAEHPELAARAAALMDAAHEPSPHWKVR